MSTRRTTPKGTPVGRRVFLGMLGLGAAGIVWGAKVQSGLERLLRPITLNDRTGITSFLPTSGRFRIYSVTGSLPAVSEADYRLTVDGLVDTPATLTLARPPSASPDRSRARLPVRDRLARARRALARRHPLRRSSTMWE